MAYRWTTVLLVCAVFSLLIPAVASAGQGKLVRLKLALPDPLFPGTPKHIKLGPNLEGIPGKAPSMLAPEGTTNVALKKEVTASDDPDGELEQVTDGDKKGDYGSYIEMPGGRQWIQIDLARPYRIYAVAIWHYFREARVYHDIAVQVADDGDFIANVRTVYNNDYDNSSGLGLGRDKEYIESNKGKLIDAKGVQARYVRLYSNGSTANRNSHYVEVEVFGKPAS